MPTLQLLSFSRSGVVGNAHPTIAYSGPLPLARGGLGWGPL
jgi:hypothetical protein